MRLPGCPTSHCSGRGVAPPLKGKALAGGGPQNGIGQTQAQRRQTQSGQQVPDIVWLDATENPEAHRKQQHITRLWADPSI
jgi:hypothetical protein